MQHNLSLDGIRGVAVLSVMFFHARAPNANFGFLGVDIFFVLSGFLITNSLVLQWSEKGFICYCAFIRRRIERLLPALAVFLLLFALFAPLLSTMSYFESFSQSVFSLFFVTNYSVAFLNYPQELSHLWSLACEYHFYIFWPIVLRYIFKAYGAEALVHWCFSLFLVAFLWRLYVQFEGVAWGEIYYRGDTRLSGFFAGAAFSAYVQSGRAQFGIVNNRAFFFFLLACLVLVSFADWGDIKNFSIAVVSAEAIAICLISLSLGHNYVSKVLAFQPLRFFGRISYSLYLWHYPFFVFARSDMGWFEVMAVWGSVSVMFAALSFKIFEEPYFKRK